MNSQTLYTNNSSIDILTDMNSASTLAVQNFIDFGIISNTLSPQDETVLSSCEEIAMRDRRMTKPRVMDIAEAEKVIPQLFEQLAVRLSVPTNQLIAVETPNSFTIDSSFLGTRVAGTTNHGQVMLLPEVFLPQAGALSMQKPSLVSALSIDYISAGSYYCWKSNQTPADSTYDLWLWPHHAEIIDGRWLQGVGLSADDAINTIRHCWTDVIIVCGGKVIIGGFWSDTEDSYTLQVESHSAVNYKAQRCWSSDELDEAQQRFSAIGSAAPWEQDVCANAAGRRYRFVNPL